jgi:hypothetical protein
VIVGSLLLILVAVTLLVLGLADGSSPLLVGSIGASLLAAIALVIGARQAAAARAGADGYLEDGVRGDRDGDEVESQRRRRSGAYAERGEDQRVGASRGASAGAMTGVMPASAGAPPMAPPAPPPMEAPANGVPGQYGTPARSGVPGQYGTPVQPGEYGTPGEYGAPAQPGVPGQSGVSGQYGTPARADQDEFGDQGEFSDEITDDHHRDSDLADDLRDSDLAGNRRESDLAGVDDDHDLADLDDDDDPPDEPAPQAVSAADAARVARMSADVLVIDGRPRYHLAGCVHLLGRESEPLPVGEAVELGFTPCSLCEPDSALLADARRV